MANKSVSLSDRSHPFHAGIHILVIHEQTLQVIFKRNFVTWQPAMDKYLIQTLKNIRDARYLVVLGAVGILL